MNGLEILTQATPEKTFLIQSYLFSQGNLEAFVLSQFQLKTLELDIPSFDLLITPCCTCEIKISFQNLHVFDNMKHLPWTLIKEVKTVLLKHHCGVHHKTLSVEYLTWHLYQNAPFLRLYLDVKYSLFHHPIYINEWYLYGLLFENKIICEQENIKIIKKIYDFHDHKQQLRRTIFSLKLYDTDPTLLPFLLIKKDGSLYYFHQGLVSSKKFYLL